MSVPVAHDVLPDTVYPVLQVGVHVAPLARALPQPPFAPLVGGADASHGFAARGRRHDACGWVYNVDGGVAT